MAGDDEKVMGPGAALTRRELLTMGAGVMTFARGVAASTGAAEAELRTESDPRSQLRQLWESLD